jgi:hypothetical protein
MTATMNKGEREALQVLIRQRERVLKSAAKQRSSELLADFENQLGSIYSYDNDNTWAEASVFVRPARLAWRLSGRPPRPDG